MPDIKVNCPHCQTVVAWTKENRYRPFCSERCQLIDLGEWANEEKRIAALENDLMSSELE